MVSNHSGNRWNRHFIMRFQQEKRIWNQEIFYNGISWNWDCRYGYRDFPIYIMTVPGQTLLVPLSRRRMLPDNNNFNLILDIEDKMASLFFYDEDYMVRLSMIIDNMKYQCIYLWKHFKNLCIIFIKNLTLFTYNIWWLSLG